VGARRGRMLMMRWGLVVCLALGCTGTPRADEKAPFDQIVVFGTSLSDSGNAFVLIGGHNTPPDWDVDGLLVPNSAYSQGGHHLTNGPTWIEQLARPLALSASVQPSLQTQGVQGTNYAIGSSRAVSNPASQLPTLELQVGMFLSDFHGLAPSTALYVIEMGSNDVSDALTALSHGQNGGAILTAAVQSIALHIQTLYAAGARHFLVMNVPNVGLTPAVRATDAVIPGTSALAAQLTVLFNTGLSGALNGLDLLPGIQITRVDAFDLVTHIVAAPSAFGFTNVRDACITPDVAPFRCSRPDTYLYWDGVHPTTAAHGVLAGEAAARLGLD
jgi:phospholipase/lecithinase/hemolysin